MVIIGVLAGTAIPVYIGMGPSIRLSGATRQIMGDLMWARMQAISQNNEYKVFFLDDHRYQILDDTDNDGNIDSDESTITKDIQEKYDGVTFTSNNSPIFHPRGNACANSDYNHNKFLRNKNGNNCYYRRVKKQ